MMSPLTGTPAVLGADGMTAIGLCSTEVAVTVVAASGHAGWGIASRETADGDSRL